MKNFDSIVVVNGISSVKSTSKQKNPVDAVLQRARRLFDKQIDNSAAVKKQCIDLYLSSSTSLAKDQFYGEYLNRVCRLLDSKTFCEDCVSFGLDPYNVATHFVFCGMTHVYKILDDGLQSFRSLFPMIKDPVFNREDLEKYDTRNKMHRLLAKQLPLK